MLSLFKRYDTHVTWAIVGLLAHDSLNSLKEKNGEKSLPYALPLFSPFPLTDKKYETLVAEQLLGIKELRAILNTPYQELGSHTYSHLYCVEEGIDERAFKEDCEWMKSIEETIHHKFTSLVFPRNQVNANFLPICARYGYNTYRGNQENRFWSNSAFTSESFFKKAGRVLDAYAKISKTQTYRLDELRVHQDMINIPANRFLRPYSGKFWLEKRKIKRIKREMLKAAREGTIYHLWWHPHNFATNLDKSLNQLEELLAYSIVLRNNYAFTSLNMQEIASHVKD